MPSAKALSRKSGIPKNLPRHPEHVAHRNAQLQPQPQVGGSEVSHHNQKRRYILHVFGVTPEKTNVDFNFR